MQHTITVMGKRYTGKQVSSLMSKDHMTDSRDHYIVCLNGIEYLASYEQAHGDVFYDAVSLVPRDNPDTPVVWIEL